MSFTSLGLSNLLSETIKSLYDAPTSLQEQAIPIILKNNDLMVATQAGTGKIGSFALPIIEKLFPNGDTERKPLTPKQTRVLILIATQEEAIQVTDYFKAYSFDFPLDVACVLDNVSITPQIKILGRGVDVLIATPTRLTELVAQEAINLSAVEIIVLDEADLLTNDNLIQKTKDVIHQLPTTRQTLLFSSSFTDDVIVSAHFFLKNPETIEINSTPSIEHIKQHIYSIPTRQKVALLAHLIKKYNWPQLLVFTRTKYGANRLADYLITKGITVKTVFPKSKDNSVSDFKEQTAQVLITVDMPLETLNINQLSCLVNFDLPYIENDYAQRIVFFKRLDEVISFVSPEEEKLLLVIESHINQKIADGDMTDFIFDESEFTTVGNDRFKRIYRHPAVGRKSRQRKQPEDIIEQDISPTQQTLEEQTEQKPKRFSKTPLNQTRTKKTRNIYNKHRRNTPNQNLSDTPPINRPEDEFRDDDYDNFGNSVDYISPYQAKGKNNHNKRIPKTNFANDTTSTVKTAPARTYKPRTKPTNNQFEQTTEQRRPRNSLYRRNTRSNSYDYNKEVMVTTPTPSLNEPTEQHVQKRTASVPAIIHRKTSRVDRLPTIEQLDSIPNRHIVKGEKPALLTRKNNTDDE